GGAATPLPRRSRRAGARPVSAPPKHVRRCRCVRRATRCTSAASLHQLRANDRVELREPLLEERVPLRGDLRLRVRRPVTVAAVQLLDDRNSLRNLPEWGEALPIETRAVVREI